MGYNKKNKNKKSGAAGTVASRTKNRNKNANANANVLLTSTFAVTTMLAKASKANCGGGGGDVCFHMSTKEDFLAYKSDNYHKCCDDYLKYRWKMAMRIPGQDINQLHLEFSQQHSDTLIQNKFGSFVFAVCCGLFLQNKESSENLNENENLDENSANNTNNNASITAIKQRKSIIMQLLALGIDVRYHWVPSIVYGISIAEGSSMGEKHRRYVRDIMTERGMINIIARETMTLWSSTSPTSSKSSCNCMEISKKAAKREMEKSGYCMGCQQEFPKNELRKCSHCQASKYCSSKCQTDNWSEHKEFCREIKINETKQTNK